MSIKHIHNHVIQVLRRARIVFPSDSPTAYTDLANEVDPSSMTEITNRVIDYIAQEQLSRLANEVERLTTEVERLAVELAPLRVENERLRAALADIARGDYSDPLCMKTPEQRAREAIAKATKEKP